MMLTRIGFEADANRIEKTWQDFVEVMGYTPVPEYQQCYPESLLSEIVSAAQEGIEGTGVQTAKPDTLTQIVGLLNSAWQEFWRLPKDYQAWETAQLETLRAATGTS